MRQASIPPTVSIDQVKGFTLHAPRNVLWVRIDELINLASTNFGRHLFEAGSHGSNG